LKQEQTFGAAAAFGGYTFADKATPKSSTREEKQILTKNEWKCTCKQRQFISLPRIFLNSLSNASTTL
jgi:hypothetical protein